MQRSLPVLMALVLLLLSTVGWRTGVKPPISIMTRGVNAYLRGNYATALRQFKPLAEKGGHAWAQYQLGVMNHLGRGVPKNRVYSHMWYNIAALKGHKNSLRRRDLMATEMAPSQIDESQDLAIECEKKKYKGC